VAISTSDLRDLPEPQRLRRVAIALALLDAVMSPEWQYRYYSFDAAWSPHEAMASMRNGAGDHWFALFSEAGVAIVGLDHEAPSFEPGQPAAWIFRDLPAEFQGNVRNEPAFGADDSTFCIWRLATDGEWRCGVSQAPDAPPEDGSAWLLELLSGEPQAYVEFASEYFEAELSLPDVRAVYEHAPMSPALAARLCSDSDYEAVRAAAREIGYPVDG